MPHRFSSMSCPKPGTPPRPFISEDARAIAQFSDDDLRPFIITYYTMAPEFKRIFWLMSGSFATKLAFIVRHAFTNSIDGLSADAIAYLESETYAR